MLRHRHIIAALVVGALLGFAGQAQAQWKSPEERYEEMKKSPLLAASLELIIPTVGHDYAGERKAALLPTALMVVGLGLAVGAGIAPCHRRIIDRDPGCDTVDVLGTVGVFAFFGSRVWATVSAWRLANRTNAYYRKQLRLDDADLALSVTPAGQLGLGVSLRF